MKNKKNIMMVFGTRPEAIKMSALYLDLKNQIDLFDVKLCVTAQHREMLDQVLRVFNISPDIDLDIMKSGQSLSSLTSAIIDSMTQILIKNRPDLLLVHGDTTTTFASSLAAFYLNIPVGHVEAGLRTFNLSQPFPEEFNRQIVTKLSKYHFAPTELNKENLINEGIDERRIYLTGNTVIDSLFWLTSKLENSESYEAKVRSELNTWLKFDWSNEKFVLITGHRRENFGEGLSNICNAVKKLAENNKSLHFIYPVHLNPNVKEPVSQILSEVKNVHLIDPLNYEPFIYLLKECFLVLTDSGGIQEEAPSLGKPVLVMRNNTERPEALEAGTVKLVGTDESQIITNVQSLFDNESEYHAMTRSHNPYGDGEACKRIIMALRKI